MSTREIPKLHELLAQDLQPAEDITNYEMKPLTAAGDSFGSEMMSLDVTITNNQTGKKRTLHLVNKMVPPDIFVFKVFDPKIVYTKEMNFYLKAVPAMLKFQQDCGVSKEDWISNFIPKCYGARSGFEASFDKNAAILLENLKCLGYGLRSDKRGLDLNHTRLTMKKLAYFHALSIALRMKRRTEYKTCVLRAGEHFEFATEIPNRPNMAKKLVEIDRQIFQNLPVKALLIDKALRIISKKNLNHYPDIKEPFVTLVHNDLWANNLMFAPDKKNNEIPADIVFVDFQMTVVNSPMCDVMFFLFTSVESSVRTTYFDDLIDVYCRSFCKCLRQLNCDTSLFSKTAFLAEIDRVAAGKLFDINDRLRVICDDEKPLHVPAWYYNVELGGDEYRRRIVDILKFYEERKWLEV